MTEFDESAISAGLENCFKRNRFLKNLQTSKSKL